jgi:hypothetical protein
MKSLMVFTFDRLNMHDLPLGGLYDSWNELQSSLGDEPKGDWLQKIDQTNRTLALKLCSPKHYHTNSASTTTWKLKQERSEPLTFVFALNLNWFASLHQSQDV